MTASAGTRPSAQPTLSALPPGTIELARRYWRRTGADPMGDDALVELFLAPLRLEPDWPSPAEPVAVGDGWVHVEVIDEERPIVHELARQPDNADPERLAAVAQSMRLPVAPYRRPTRPVSGRNRQATSGTPADPTVATGATVIDLSTHWAGPLATKLLVDAGATVIKIDPDCRPDGFRDRARLYRSLNDGKEIVDLDLRSDDGRRRFETLVAGADLVVESFSRRVMGNLGYGPTSLSALSPGLSQVAIRAYPIGTPEQDWIGFGPGVHAASGLGLIGPEPMPPPVAYPDVLTALVAFDAALRALADQGRGDRPVREVTLSEAVAPLLSAASGEGFVGG